MSAYLTHLSFGIKNYQCMEQGNLKEAIHKHRHAYFYGLAGPDIFFYDLPNGILGKNKVGCVLHEKRTGAFIQNLLLEANRLSCLEKEIAFAYIAGFICHYEIDCATHPYIYGIIGEHSGKKGAGRHFELEAAYDVYSSVSILGKTPSKMKQNRILFLRDEEEKVITKLYCKVYGKTFGSMEKGISKYLPKILQTYQLTPVEMKLAFFCTTVAVTFLHDGKGILETVLRLAEKVIWKYPVLSPLYCNDNTYDLTLEDWAYYRNLCEDGLLETLRVADSLERWISTGNELDFSKLAGRIGSKSYHTGLPNE